MARYEPPRGRWPQRFKTAIRERFLLRFHMLLILVAVILSGIGISKLLWLVGLGQIHLRYPLAVLGSYGVFFALIRVWLWYVALTHDEPAARQGRDVDGVEDAGELVELAVDVASDVQVAAVGQGASGGGSWSVGDVGDSDGAGLVLLLLVVLLCVVFGSGLYLMWQAPALLSEAALQMVLAGSLRRATRRIDAPGWAGSVLGATWLPFVLVVIMVWIFAMVAGSVCPGATRLAEVLACVAP